MPAPDALPFTYREYALLPADGRRWELLEGGFHVSPAPSPRHQTVSRRLQHVLMHQLEDTGVAQVFNAPIDLIFSEVDTVQPDLAIIRSGREHLITQRGIECSPELVIEILSPSNRAQDLVLKRRIYAHYGVTEYWLVDADANTVEVLLLEKGDYREQARFTASEHARSVGFPEIDIVLAHVFGKA